VKAPPDRVVIVSKIIVGTSNPSPQNVELAPPSLDYEPMNRTEVPTTKKSTDSLAQAVVAPAFGTAVGKTQIDVSVSPPGPTWSATLLCKLKESRFHQWQLGTYEAILNAYNRQVAAYEERLANAQVALRMGAFGISPEQKREVERTEIKRACISLLTYQHFDLFNAVDLKSPHQINFEAAEAQGPYIRFFEQAIEWEQMSYLFYPYFWSRKGEWTRKLNRQDRDPQFSKFLSAGAARALLPVRPGFEKAVIHFMETGQIWAGAICTRHQQS
jgi:hypothetical protein